MQEQVDTVIVGGGQAGLSASYHLSRLGCGHVILERNRIGESWRSERWDSLMFQFPNWAIRLPGHSYKCADADGFVPRSEVVSFLEEYARLIQAPLRCGVRATLVHQQPQSGRFVVEAGDTKLEAKNVVVAIGSFHQPKIPAFHTELSRHVLQIHSRDYRNPGQLPPGAVLVVGGGASGVQIAEELHESGREVYFSIGRYRRTPRRYRGRDIYWWFGALQIWDRPVEQFPEVKDERFPLVTGVGGGRDIDLRRLRADGVKMLGRLRGISAGRIFLADDLEQHLTEGEAWFASFRKRMDEYAHANGLDLPKELAEKSASTSEGSTLPHPILELETEAAGISAVIWATGFRYDFEWVKLPVFDDSGEPLQRRGVSPCPGFYFLGLRRMYTMKSNIFEGVGDDAAYIVEHLAART
jgi:putative flavoprotein involved in K+ transport